MRLCLGAWLQNATPYQEALEINLSSQPWEQVANFSKRFPKVVQINMVIVLFIWAAIKNPVEEKHVTRVPFLRKILAARGGEGNLGPQMNKNCYAFLIFFGFCQR